MGAADTNRRRVNMQPTNRPDTAHLVFAVPMLVCAIALAVYAWRYAPW